MSKRQAEMGTGSGPTLKKTSRMPRAHWEPVRMRSRESTRSLVFSGITVDNFRFDVGEVAVTMEGFEPREMLLGSRQSVLLWLEGLGWLCSERDFSEEVVPNVSVPEECKGEMRRRDTAHLLITHDGDTPRLTQLVNLEYYSSSYPLFRVTALVLRFMCCLRSHVNDTLHPSAHPL